MKPQGRKAMKVRAPGVRKLRKMIDRVPGQPVVDRDVYSARYSRWNDDKAWSSQEWKADKSIDDRTERPVVTSWERETLKSQSSFFHEKTKHVIVGEEEPHGATCCVFSKRSKATAIYHWKRRNRIRIVNGTRSFLNRVNDRVRKKQKRSSMNIAENDEKHSMIWRCSCL